MRLFASIVLLSISSLAVTCKAQTLQERVTAAGVQPTPQQVLINDLWLTLQDAQAPLQAQVTTLQTQVTTLQAQVTSLQGQLATANKTISSLNATITTRNNTIKTLNAQIATLNTQIASLNATITSLRAQLATWPGACPAAAVCPVCQGCIQPPVVVPPPPSTTGVALAWDAVSTAVGYRIYWGNSSGVYLQGLGTGGASTPLTTFIVPNLTNGRWYFAVTAFDALTNESFYSNEVFKDIGPAIVESPSGTMLTAPGGSIIDSLGAVWTLGAPDASGFPVKMRNGVVDGSAAVLCYSARAVNSRGDLAGGWWKWTDNATLPLGGSWSSVITPAGCV